MQGVTASFLVMCCGPVRHDPELWVEPFSSKSVLRTVPVLQHGAFRRLDRGTVSCVCPSIRPRALLLAAPRLSLGRAFRCYPITTQLPHHHRSDRNGTGESRSTSILRPRRLAPHRFRFHCGRLPTSLGSTSVLCFFPLLGVGWGFNSSSLASGLMTVAPSSSGPSGSPGQNGTTGTIGTNDGGEARSKFQFRTLRTD